MGIFIFINESHTDEKIAENIMAQVIVGIGTRFQVTCSNTFVKNLTQNRNLNEESKSPG